MTAMNDKLLSEFVDAWNAGRRPQVSDYLERAAPGERDELAELLEDWLTMAPTPTYSDETLAAISAEPALVGALAEIESDPVLLPEVLPRLRERAGLKVRDLASRVTAVFGLAGEEERAEDYLTRLVSGELEPTRVSRRLLAALGSLLGADLLRAAGLRAAGASPGQALFRAEREAGASFEVDLDALSRAAMAPAPEPMDELDRLFTGGPDA